MAHKPFPDFYIATHSTGFYYNNIHQFACLIDPIIKTHFSSPVPIQRLILPSTMPPNTRKPGSRGLNTSLPLRTNNPQRNNDQQSSSVPESQELSFLSEASSIRTGQRFPSAVIPETQDLSYLSDVTVTPSSNATQGHNNNNNTQHHPPPPAQELSFLSEASSARTTDRFPSAAIPDTEELSYLSDVTVTPSSSATQGHNNNFNTQHHHHPLAAPAPVHSDTEELSYLSDATVIHHSHNIQHPHHPPAAQAPYCPVSEDLSCLSDATETLPSGTYHAHNSNARQIQRHQPATIMPLSSDIQQAMAGSSTEAAQAQPQGAVQSQHEIVDLEDYVEPSNETGKGASHLWYWPLFSDRAGMSR